MFVSKNNIRILIRCFDTVPIAFDCSGWIRVHSISSTSVAYYPDIAIMRRQYKDICNPTCSDSSGSIARPSRPASIDGKCERTSVLSLHWRGAVARIQDHDVLTRAALGEGKRRSNEPYS